MPVHEPSRALLSAVGGIPDDIDDFSKYDSLGLTGNNGFSCSRKIVNRNRHGWFCTIPCLVDFLNRERLWTAGFETLTTALGEPRKIRSAGLDSCSVVDSHATTLAVLIL